MSFGAYGFLRVMDAVGMRLVLSRDLDEDYQGSVAAIVQHQRWRGGDVDEDEEFGYITIGYGSCSGCDHWESIQENPEEVLNDTAGYIREMRRFPNLAALKDHMREFDHETQWYGRDERFQKFRDEVLAIRDGMEYEGFSER